MITVKNLKILPLQLDYKIHNVIMTNRHLIEQSADNHSKIIAFSKLGDVSKNQHSFQPIQCMAVKHEEHFLNLHRSLNIVLRCFHGIIFPKIKSPFFNFLEKHVHCDSWKECKLNHFLYNSARKHNVISQLRN